MPTGSIVEPQDASRGELRARLHGMWAAVAPGWETHADYVDERGAQLNARMLDLGAVGAADRVLELACGPGGLGLAAAERVGSGGEVVLSDVVPEMTSIAAARAAARGLRNTRPRVLDLDDIDEPDAGFDAVLCREGLMFATDPHRAVREIHRVLRPGGRAAVAVWGPRADNPWLALVFDAVGAQLGAPVPPPGVPGPFSLEDRAQLEGLLSRAGLVDVAVEECPVPLRAGSFDEWWARTRALAGPLAKLLESLPGEAREEIRARLRDSLAGHATARGIELPGLSLVASGRRPA